MLCGLVCKLLRPCCSKVAYGVIFIRLQSDTILLKGMLSILLYMIKNVAQSSKIYCNSLHYRHTCIHLESTKLDIFCKYLICYHQVEIRQCLPLATKASPLIVPAKTRVNDGKLIKYYLGFLLTHFPKVQPRTFRKGTPPETTFLRSFAQEWLFWLHPCRVLFSFWIHLIFQ